jgi:hypothetical protein
LTREALLRAWELPRGFDLRAMIAITQQDLLLPDLRVRLLSSTGDTITVQVVEGAPPVSDAILLYIQGRGVYDVLRREMWPGGRVLLTLAAWPKS